MAAVLKLQEDVSELTGKPIKKAEQGETNPLADTVEKLGTEVVVLKAQVEKLTASNIALESIVKSLSAPAAENKPEATKPEATEASEASVKSKKSKK